MTQGHKSNKPTGCLSIVRTFDLELVRQTMTHPKVYPHISDDTSPEPEEFIPPENDLIMYLAGYEHGEYRGLFMFHPVNGVTLEVHTCLLPSAYGKAHEFTAKALEHIWINTSAVRIITQVPDCNRLAKVLAEKTGMTEYGVNPKSFLHNGELYDIHLLGISK